MKFWVLFKGDASVEEIDKAMQRSWSYTKGPLEVMDFIGLDIVVNTLDSKHCFIYCIELYSFAKVVNTFFLSFVKTLSK